MSRLLPTKCPHCLRSLDDEWTSLRIQFDSGDIVDREVECPHCGRDMDGHYCTSCGEPEGTNDDCVACILDSGGEP